MSEFGPQHELEPGDLEGPDIVEGELSVEQESDELERIQDAAVARFQERGIKIDRDRLRNLITELRYGDLNSPGPNDSTVEYRPDNIYAEVERNGRVTVDRVEFSKQDEQQKLHTILHEASHRLDWLISPTSNIDWQEVSDIIPEMDPNDMSPYLVHLAEKFKDLQPEELAKIIRQEAMPEFIAQYVESDGTFKSFVEQSGLETADLLDGFENIEDTAIEQFFAEYPELQFRFHIFVNLRSVLHDENLVAEHTANWSGDYDDDFYDELELVSWMAEKPPQMPAEQVKKNPPPKPQPGLFDFFWLFRKDNGKD